MTADQQALREAAVGGNEPEPDDSDPGQDPGSMYSGNPTQQPPPPPDGDGSNVSPASMYSGGRRQAGN